MKIYCVCILILAGCAPPQSSERPVHPVEPQTNARPEAIDLTDGVSKDEAAILAQKCYRDQFGESKGQTRYSGETGTHWIFRITKGDPGTFESTAFNVYIDKTNGVFIYDPVPNVEQIGGANRVRLPRPR